MLIPYVVCVFVCRKLSPHLGSQVFFSCVVSLCDFAYYVFGYEPAIAMHLSLWYVVLVCHQYDYDVSENSVGSGYIGGYGGLSESGLCVFRELCQSDFL